jgi:hypothetical protein
MILESGRFSLHIEESGPQDRARIRKGRGVYRDLVKKPERKRPLGRPKRRWEIILRRIFRKWDVGVWTGLSWLRIETVGGRL